jgi:hypothetical protein
VYQTSKNDQKFTLFFFLLNYFQQGLYGQTDSSFHHQQIKVSNRTSLEMRGGVSATAPIETAAEFLVTATTHTHTATVDASYPNEGFKK